VILRGHGIVLREWTDDDLDRMSELFDEPSIEQATPLETPFDRAAAARYLARARESRAEGRAIQLAITTDGGAALGEVLLFGIADGCGELGYAVGVAHRGQGLGARAVRLLVDHAAEQLGLHRFLLKIAPGNAASARVAAAAGFSLTDEPLEIREAKGRAVELATWERLIPRAAGAAPTRARPGATPRRGSPPRCPPGSAAGGLG
jgi:RimJ/RimL family protein N-acetyltransferase